MSYTALYRKWRPKDFGDVHGQEHIVKTLTNQIASERIAHAYLFSGTRGTGKTSTAKIFAQAVNCESPQNGSPCHQCGSCIHIEAATSMNVIEIDAASNNGVDNIREIREEVRYTPTEGKYKVYIIDEVHMLSTGAFNALLKTLEEPPAHVIFVLATTEPHKIPATVLSRCQRYDFRRITAGTISESLLGYMKADGIEVEEKAIKYIARVADGSMRDALSILDQCIAFYIGEKITLEKVLDVMGAVDDDVFIELAEALHAGKADACMDIVEKVTMQGRELVQFISDAVMHLRNILVAGSIPDPTAILDVTEEHLEDLKKQSGLLTEEELFYLIKQLSETENRMKFAASKRIILEVELLKLCQRTMDSTEDGLTERVRLLESRMDEAPPVVYVDNSTNRGKDKEGKEETAEKKKAIDKKPKVNIEAIPEDIQRVIKEWDGVVDNMETINKAFLKKSVPINMGDNVLYVVCDNALAKKHLTQQENMDKLVAVLEKTQNKSFNIKIIDQDEYQRLSGSKTDHGNGMDAARQLYEHIQSKIHFDIEIR